MAKQKPKNKYERTFLLLMIEGSTGNLIKDIRNKKTEIKQVGIKMNDIRLLINNDDTRNAYARLLFRSLLKDYDPEKTKEKT